MSPDSPLDVYSQIVAGVAAELIPASPACECGRAGARNAESQGSGVLFRGRVSRRLATRESARPRLRPRFVNRRRVVNLRTCCTLRLLATHQPASNRNYNITKRCQLRAIRSAKEFALSQLRSAAAADSASPADSATQPPSLTRRLSSTSRPSLSRRLSRRRLSLTRGSAAQPP